jgi:cytoplasmic tRNA 2-thiolation protein 2
MCSLQETDELAAIKDTANLTIQRVPCIKCKTSTATINLRFAVYCDDCFAEQAHHKYRAAVSKTRPRHVKERILLALDGRNKLIESCFLVLLCTETARSDQQRQLTDVFEAVALADPTGALERVCRECNLPFSVVSVQHPAYERLVASSSNGTAVQDMKRVLELRTLVEYAKKTEFTRLYFPDTSNDLALEMMAMTCKGLGYVVPWEMQPVKTVSGVGIVRPLRDHHRQEAGEYLRIKSIQVDFKAYTHSDSSSLNDITRAFLDGLDRDYSATVSTVTKTALKITTDWTDQPSDYKECAICFTPTRDAQVCKACSVAVSELDGWTAGDFY